MQLIGLARIGRDAEVRYTPAGKAVANISLAFNYGARVDGQQPTQWIDAALFGDRAEKLASYLTKGTLLCVTLDNPHVETYQKKDGTTGSKLVAFVAALEFAGGSKEREEQTPMSQRAPAPASKPAAQLPGGVQDMTDDVPF